MTLADLQARESEYRENIAKRMLETDKYYKEVAASNVAKQTTPLRRGELRHTPEYFWNDAIWCQDAHMQWVWAEEFFEVQFELDEDYDKNIQPWLCTVWEEEFRKTLPEYNDTVSFS